MTAKIILTRFGWITFARKKANWSAFIVTLRVDAIDRKIVRTNRVCLAIKINWITSKNTHITLRTRKVVSVFRVICQ